MLSPLPPAANRCASAPATAAAHHSIPRWRSFIPPPAPAVAGTPTSRSKARTTAAPSADRRLPSRAGQSASAPLHAPPIRRIRPPAARHETRHSPPQGCPTGPGPAGLGRRRPSESESRRCAGQRASRRGPGPAQPRAGPETEAGIGRLAPGHRLRHYKPCVWSRSAPDSEYRLYYRGRVSEPPGRGCRICCGQCSRAGAAGSGPDGRPAHRSFLVESQS